MSTSTTAPARPVPRGPGHLVAATSAASLLIVVPILTVLAGAAGAQSTTTLSPTTTVPAENPGSTAAGFVFFGISAAIVVGALVLYLRNRRPRVASPDA